MRKLKRMLAALTALAMLLTAVGFSEEQLVPEEAAQAEELVAEETIVEEAIVDEPVDDEPFVEESEQEPETEEQPEEPGEQESSEESGEPSQEGAAEVESEAHNASGSCLDGGEHVWDSSSGQCTICGAVCEHDYRSGREGECAICGHICDHDDLKAIEYEPGTTGGYGGGVEATEDRQPWDSEFHVVNYTGELTATCSICGAWLYDGEFGSCTYLEKHKYGDSSICECGYDPAACKHEHTKFVLESEDSGISPRASIDGQAQDLDASVESEEAARAAAPEASGNVKCEFVDGQTHRWTMTDGTGKAKYSLLCTICGGYVHRERNIPKDGIVYGHSFDEKGKCTNCGYVSVCPHEHTKFVLESEDSSKLKCELVDDSDHQWEKHLWTIENGTGTETYSLICKDCGEYVVRVQPIPAGGVETEHTFEESGYKCVDCGVVESGFTLGVDNSNYIHFNSNSIHCGFAGVKDYSFSDQSYYDRLIEGAAKKDINYLKNYMYDPWDGSCYGISATMGLVYKGYIGLKDISNSSASLYHDMDYPCNDAKLLNSINYYQMSQCIRVSEEKRLDSVAVSAYSGGFLRSVLLYKQWGEITTVDATVFFPKLLEYVEKNGVAMFQYYISQGGASAGHCVLITGYRFNKDTGNYIVKLYDVSTVQKNAMDGGFVSLRIKEDFSDFELYNPTGLIARSNSIFLMYVVDWDKLREFNHNLTSRSVSNRTKIEVSLDNPFRIDADNGTYLAFDGEQFSGDMEIYNVDCGGTEREFRLVIYTDHCDTYQLTELGNNVDIRLWDDSNYMSLEGERVSSATISLSEGMDIRGNDYAFSAYVSTDHEVAPGENGLIRVSGNAQKDVALKKDGDKLNVSSEAEMSDVEVSTFVGNEKETTQIEAPASDITVSDDGSTGPEPSAEKATSIKINEPERNRINIGETLTLTTTASPAEARPALLWYSSNHSVATVSREGKVTALGAGSTKITVKTDNGKSSKALKITVVDPTVPTKLALPKALTAGLGEIVELKGQLTNLEPATAELKWTSSKPEVVKVDEDTGRAEMLSTGKAKITVSPAASKKKKPKASITVTVTDSSAPKKLTLDIRGTKKVTTDEDFRIAPTLDPAGSSEIEWTSSKPDVAIVDQSGNVTTIGKGSTTIRATAKKKDASGKTVSASVKVQVTKDNHKPESLSMEQSELRLTTDDEPRRIAAALSPSGVKYGQLSWKNSNKYAVEMSVDEGTSAVTLKPLAAGTATITVASKEDKGRKATLTVAVEDPHAPTEFSLADGKTKTVHLGEEGAKLTPVFGGADKWSAVKYTLKKKGIVEIDNETGAITPLKEGTVKVTAKTAKKIGTGKRAATKSASITIKVVNLERPKKIAIDNEEAVKEAGLKVGVPVRLTCTITAEDGTQQKSGAKWSCNKPKYALVDDNGQVCALKAGVKVKITATTEAKGLNGKAKKVTITLQTN